MSEHGPSIKECRAAYIAANMGYTKSVSRYEALGALFDRMIAEVERAASAKGWDKGFVTAAGKAASWNILHGIGVPGLPMTNPYRRNEGENDA